MSYDLTVGRAEDGRKIAIISTGGHVQRPGSGPMTVLSVEVVDGWPYREIKAWFRRMQSERPWETRQ